MPSRISVTGTIASPGYGAGPLFVIDAAAGRYAPSGDPVAERQRLADAIATALAEIVALGAALSGDASEMVEFQMMMLDDDSLSEAAFAAIDDGTDAASAWGAALGEQVAGYDAADDDYFRARSADLVDIRDRVLRALLGVVDTVAPPGSVLFGREITPSQFLATNWSAGGAILLREGSPASHVAMLARSRGIPMLVGIGALEPEPGEAVLVDAEAGRAEFGPDPEARHQFDAASFSHAETLAAAEELLGRPAATADGVPVTLYVNIADPGEVDRLDIAHCDGVGLMRTEFLYTDGLPDEDAQYEAYRKVLAWAGDKPVTIRTVDAGGDKPVPGFTPTETNPFLGLRGIRLCLARPEIFRTQIRALLRAGTAGNLKIMFPMISIAAEFAAARDLFAEEAASLGLPVPPLGIMVEVPAAAIDPGAFSEAAFFSIGSNDLTQYVMAAARDNGSVAALNDPLHPAILALVRIVAGHGAAHDIPVSLCGDAGGEPRAIPHLLQAGLRQLSVAPSQLARARAAIATTSLTPSGAQR